MRWNEVLLNYPSLSLQSENRPFLPLMEFNLLDYIITDVLLTYQPRAAALLNHPPIARIVAHHIRSLEARIQAVYETRHGVRQIVRCDGFSIVPTRDLLVQTAHGVMTIGAYMLHYSLSNHYPARLFYRNVEYNCSSNSTWRRGLDSSTTMMS